MQNPLASWRRRREYRNWEKAVRLIGRIAVDIQARAGCSWEEAKARASTLPSTEPGDDDYQDLRQLYR